MRHFFLRRFSFMLLVAAAGGCFSIATRAEEPKRSLEEAALARRLEEYSDTKKGEARAAEDQEALAAIDRFVAALIATDVKAMLPLTSLPWMAHAESIREREALERRLGEYRVPAVFERGAPKVLLIGSLEELELALGKQVPAVVRQDWANHLKGSRIAVVLRGPMLIGFSLRQAEKKFHVSGLLIDYFPKPDDPLLRAISKGPQGKLDK